MKNLFINLFRKVLPDPLKSTIEKNIFLIKRFYKIQVFKPDIILFYPEIPANWYVINRICDSLGMEIINNPKERFHLVFNWQDKTFRTMDNQLKNLVKKYEVFNIGCTDISKSHVDAVFMEVFGYSIIVDPLTYSGICVEKSNLNAKHDGKIIKCPLSNIKPECVYQKLIDTQNSDNLVEDIRAPIFKDTIPFVYLKYKLNTDRFGFSFKGVVAEVADILTQDEVIKVITFCRKMGLDYGELDIMRDKGDGKLYIVDANTTPSVRFVGFTESDETMALKRLSETFEKVFIQ